MYTHFKERGMHKAYNSPKMGCSINHSKEPNKISSICIRGSKKSKWCAKQPRHTWIHKIGKYEAQHIHHILGTKPKHAKGQVTYNIRKWRTSYRKEAHWIKNVEIIILVTWLDQIYIWISLNSSWGSQVSNDLQPHLLIKFELVGPQPSWVLRG
jgi:hypothetical protein